MLRPAKMSLISIITLKENFEKAARIVSESGIVHLEESRKFFHQKDSSIQSADMQEYIVKIKALLGGINNMLKKLNISVGDYKVSQNELNIAPFKIADQIKPHFDEIDSKLEELFSKLDKYKKDLEDKEKLSWLIPILKELNINTSLVPNYLNIKLRCGIIMSNKLYQLKESLKNIPYYLKTSNYLGGKILICILTYSQYINILDSSIKGINFEEIHLPESDDLDGLTKNIEYRVWEDRENIAEIKKKIKNLKTNIAFRLIKWRANLKLNLHIADSMGNFLESKYCYCITGWVPANKVYYIRKKLLKICSKEIEINIQPADSLENIDKAEIPTKFDNPAIIKPFQRLVTTYGIPKYNGIDPTIFVALSFIGMFGMMFGDIGHGLVLCLLGCIPFLFRGLKKLKDFGIILSGCGVSSIIFGFFFGSFFGLENVLPALWFRPLDNPIYFLKVGIFIGIGMITLGIVLNISQNIINKNFKNSFFGQWGFFSSLFYWLCLGLFWKIMVSGSIKLAWPIIALILLVPLLIITFGDIIITKMKGKEEVDLAELIFRPIEVMLGLLTNTISYVRVAAFGLTHAALMMTLFIIVSFIGKEVIGLKESLIVEGNIGVILLEGLIVFIQVLRLEYYEFFSKFFTGGGKLFKPLKLSGV